LKILAKLIFEFLRLIFRSKQGIVLENLALRQQLAVQQHSIERPKIKNTDRIFWIWLSRIWSDWRWANNVDFESDGRIRVQRLNVGFSRTKECMHFVLSRDLSEYTRAKVRRDNEAPAVLRTGLTHFSPFQ
jgi:hypothetical protein